MDHLLTTLIPTRWSSLVLFLVLLIGSGLFLVSCAPLTENNGSKSLDTFSQGSKNLLEMILKLNQKNECESDQDRKDTCEQCTRFSSDPSSAYLGCCTNTDDIYLYCQDFLAYTFGETPQAKVSSKLGVH